MKTKNQRGFIKIIVIVILIVILLGIFGFNLRGLIEKPLVQENLNYVWGAVVTIWQDYLARPVMYLWNDIFIDLIWGSFVSNMERLKAGEPTDIDLNTPYVEVQ